MAFAEALDTSVSYLLNWEEVQPQEHSLPNPLIEELTEKASKLSDDNIKLVIAVVDNLKK